MGQHGGSIRSGQHVHMYCVGCGPQLGHGSDQGTSTQ